jgi:hypothetical protein
MICQIMPTRPDKATLIVVKLPKSVLCSSHDGVPLNFHKESWQSISLSEPIRLA